MIPRDSIYYDVAWKLGWTILHSLWQGVLIALLHATAMGWLRRRSPPSRYLASLCALGLLLGAGVATFVLMTPPPQGSRDRGILASPALMTPSAAVTHVPRVQSALVSAPAIEAAARGPDRPATVDRLNDMFRSTVNRVQPAMPWIACGWGAGVLLLSLWQTGGWIATRRLCVLGVRPVDSDIARIGAQITRRLKLTRAPSVWQSERVETPVVIGWLRPMILLPVAVLSGLTTAQLEAILAHEIAHIRRHDYVVNLLQVVAETLMFYHPAAWWISRRIRLEREQCCDDIAVEVCGDRFQYAESLAALEEVRLSSPLALAARGAGGGELLARVRWLLSGETHHGGRHVWAPIAWVILLAAGITALSCEKHRSQNQTSGVTTPG